MSAPGIAYAELVILMLAMSDKVHRVPSKILLFNSHIWEANPEAQTEKGF